MKVEIVDEITKLGFSLRVTPENDAERVLIRQLVSVEIITSVDLDIRGEIMLVVEPNDE